MRLSTAIAGAAFLGTMFVITVPHWTGPVSGRPMGYRASSMVQFENKEPVVAAMDRGPPALPPGRYGVERAALEDARPAAEAFRNVTQSVKGVAGDGTAGAFMAMQVAITDWVSPKQGCAFCHKGEDFASDEVPQKRAAREMMRMTQTLNASWREHVGEGGVTCFTCHRGQNVPASVWYPAPAPPARPMIARQEAWHEAATTVHDFFPDAAYSEYLLQDGGGRHQSYTALPTTGPQPQIVLARMYEVMMQMSDGIGVNCGYCHNSRAFFDWSQSTPQRWAGLSGIQVTRAINTGFLLPLAFAIPQTRERVGGGGLPTTPAQEAGAQNGNGLATCATCHYGSPKPLQGLDLLREAPMLARLPGGAP